MIKLNTELIHKDTFRPLIIVEGFLFFAEFVTFRAIGGVYSL
jgi:hypothetical protein